MSLNINRTWPCHYKLKGKRKHREITRNEVADMLRGSFCMYDSGEDKNKK